MISANEARKRTPSQETLLKEKIDSVVDDVDTKIIVYAEAGLMSVEYFFGQHWEDVKPAVIEILKDKGFEVTEKNDKVNSPITISWGLK